MQVTLNSIRLYFTRLTQHYFLIFYIVSWNYVYHISHVRATMCMHWFDLPARMMQEKNYRKYRAVLCS